MTKWREGEEAYRGVNGETTARTRLGCCECVASCYITHCVFMISYEGRKPGQWVPQLGNWNSTIKASVSSGISLN